MILLLVFDVFAKYIMLLFFMMLVGNSVIFRIFAHLLKDKDIPGSEEINNRFKWAFHAIHAGYLITAIFAVQRNYGAFCEAGNVYRKRIYFLRCYY